MVNPDGSPYWTLATNAGRKPVVSCFNRKLSQLVWLRIASFPRISESAADAFRFPVVVSRRVW